MSLLLLRSDNIKILTNCLLEAYSTAQEQVTFERTEPIQLLILTRSSCKTFCFKSSALLDLAVKVGNVELAELLFKKA